MGFKKYSKNMSFMDLELKRIFGRSRTQQFLSEVDKRIDWEPIEQILLSRYPTGKSDVGNRAYPPLMLLKAVLLQSWFGINSDPELENQVNDRISFKVFIGLPLAENAPDHSIICRFRKRIGRDTLEKIHHELLQQFKRMGFSIESGMAVDARLVKSASRPVSGKKLEDLREERKAKAETDDTHPPKFMRDLESDWTVKNEQPHFGMKEHASVDVKSGLVLSTLLSKASVHDTNTFQATVFKGIHGNILPEKVHADKGYCGHGNRKFLAINGIKDGIMRKDQVNARLTATEIKRNKKISSLRYKIEQYFGLSHLHQGAGRARFTTIAREAWNRLSGVIGFNVKRVILGRRPAMAH